MRQLLLAAALGLAACAAGDPIGGSTAGQGPGSGGSSGEGGSGDGGSGDGGSSSPSGGPASTSVSSTTGPGTTTSTTTGVSSSASTGTPCDEQPCKLVAPQCGCGADEKCTLVSGNERGCTEDGTRAPGQACGEGIGECEAGGVCVYVFDAEDTLSCARWCESDLQCDGQGGLCAIGLQGVDDVKLCSDNCDVVSSSGCAISGTKCSVYYDATDMRNFTACVGAGAGVAQSECNNETNQCAPGFGCFQTQEEGEVYRCFKWCSSAAAECPDDLTCRTDFDPPITIGAVTYGICSG